MRLIYLSPVAWNSFPQRPHRFVQWWHEHCGGSVLWLDPYPTRLPTFADLHRLGGAPDHIAQTTPAWLKVVSVPALPIEPLPGGAWLNRWRWQRTVREALAIAANDACTLGIGKPSALAAQLLLAGGWKHSFYDAMDDFPAFFSGLSRRAAQRCEQRLGTQVDWVMASSSALHARWSQGPRPVHLIRNGLDVRQLPAARERATHTGPFVFGYVGTLSGWFDWQWVVQLAQARPQDEVRIIGPVYAPASIALPPNVKLLPALAHAQALRAMQDFDVGLIPFKANRLTASVDPIKYYEYRALGLPVLSTRFGDMTLRALEPGCFLADTPVEVAQSAVAALAWSGDALAARRFAAGQDWALRFEPLAGNFS